MGGFRSKKDMNGQSREWASIKIGKSVIDRARVIAAHRKISLADYITEIAEGGVDRDTAEMVREMSQGKGEGGPGEKPRPKPDKKAKGTPPDGSGPGDTGPVARFSPDPNLHDAPPARGRKPDRADRAGHADGDQRHGNGNH